MAEEKVPLVLRGLHWAVAMVFLLNAFVLPHGDGPHRLLGLAGTAMVVVRLLLTLKYRISYFNPKAVAVYALIWMSIIGLGVTGWMTQMNAFWGNSAVKQVHNIFAWMLIGLVTTHLAGVFIDAFRHRRKTWM
ncbi:MAG: hypothetical protein JXX14_09360, partial [Deltaproteobacteria bacterium]|nr:hypothetical protein [Deltaproteobacteria bacterium]